MACSRRYHHRYRCHHGDQTERNATRRSHPTDGHGATRPLGAGHHLCLPRISSTLRRVTPFDPARRSTSPIGDNVPGVVHNGPLMNRLAPAVLFFATCASPALAQDQAPGPTLAHRFREADPGPRPVRRRTRDGAGKPAGDFHSNAILPRARERCDARRRDAEFRAVAHRNALGRPLCPTASASAWSCNFIPRSTAPPKSS